MTDFIQVTQSDSSDIVNVAEDTSVVNVISNITIINTGNAVGDIPQNPETRLGSECTLTNGDSGRVLTLVNSSVTKTRGFQVSKGGFIINPDDYTVSHLSASSTVTFDSTKVFDTDEIVVYYFI